MLLDDDLQSVAKGMEQGRLCAENLRKSVLYTMCSKVGRSAWADGAALRCRKRCPPLRNCWAYRSPSLRCK